MQDNKMTSITIRLSDVDATKFKEEAKNKGLSQQEYLVKLIRDANVPENKINDELDYIQFSLVKKNFFCQDNKKQNLVSKKIKIKGKVLYCPPHYFVDKAREYRNELESEFEGINNLLLYNFYHVLNLFEVYDNPKYKYFVNEIFFLRDNGLITPINKGSEFYDEVPLYVSRCLYVNDFREVRDKFQKYSNYENLKELEMIMADEVKGENKELEEFF